MGSSRLEYHGRKLFGLPLLVVVASIGGTSHASDLGPERGQHSGKVIAWDRPTERLVLVEAGTNKAPRRITLWTDPQTAVAASQSGPRDLFRHDKSRGRLTLADLKPGDRIEVEWRRAGRRHVAVSVRRMP